MIGCGGIELLLDLDGGGYVDVGLLTFQLSLEMFWIMLRGIVGSEETAMLGGSSECAYLPCLP